MKSTLLKFLSTQDVVGGWFQTALLSLSSWYDSYVIRIDKYSFQSLYAYTPSHVAYSADER